MASRIFLRSELESAWAEADIFNTVNQLSGEVYRSVANRKTLRVSVNNNIYFAKIHGAVGWREILKNLVLFRLPVVGAVNEYDASRILKAGGVCVPEVAGFGLRGINPATRESFIITDAVEPSISLEDFCADWAHSKPNFKVKKLLITQVAEMTRRLHSLGLNHRDLYICHFLLDLSALKKGEYHLTLIDLHRAQKRQSVPRRWLVKDLGSLLFSCMELGFGIKDWLRFISIYTGEPLRETFRGNQSEFWQAVQKRAQKLYQQADR